MKREMATKGHERTQKRGGEYVAGWPRRETWMAESVCVMGGLSVRYVFSIQAGTYVVRLAVGALEYV